MARNASGGSAPAAIDARGRDSAPARSWHRAFAARRGGRSPRTAYALMVAHNCCSATRHAPAAASKLRALHRTESCCCGTGVVPLYVRCHTPARAAVKPSDYSHESVLSEAPVESPSSRATTDTAGGGGHGARHVVAHAANGRGPSSGSSTQALRREPAWGRLVADLVDGPPRRVRLADIARTRCTLRPPKRLAALLQVGASTVQAGAPPRGSARRGALAARHVPVWSAGRGEEPSGGLLSRGTPRSFAGTSTRAGVEAALGARHLSHHTGVAHLGRRRGAALSLFDRARPRSPAAASYGATRRGARSGGSLPGRTRVLFGREPSRGCRRCARTPACAEPRCVQASPWPMGSAPKPLAGQNRTL